MPQLSIRETTSSQEFVPSLDAAIRRLVYGYISLGIDPTAVSMIVPNRGRNPEDNCLRGRKTELECSPESSGRGGILDVEISQKIVPGGDGNLFRLAMASYGVQSIPVFEVKKEASV